MKNSHPRRAVLCFQWGYREACHSKDDIASKHWKAMCADAMCSTELPSHLCPSKRALARLSEKECSHTKSPTRVCVDGAALIVETGDRQDEASGIVSRTYTTCYLLTKLFYDGVQYHTSP